MENQWCINNYAAAIMVIEKLNFTTLQLAVIIAYILLNNGFISIHYHNATGTIRLRQFIILQVSISHNIISNEL